MADETSHNPYKPRWFMDMMILRHCLKCGHEWNQPSTKGKCPKCHSDKVQNLQAKVNQLPRV